jgi:hypothetical protein
MSENHGEDEQIQKTLQQLFCKHNAGKQTNAAPLFLSQETTLSYQG